MVVPDRVEEVEPNQPKFGWQQCVSRSLETKHLNETFPCSRGSFLWFFLLLLKFGWVVGDGSTWMFHLVGILAPAGWQV